MKTMVVLLLMLVLANGVNGDSTYACWGGCYNMCFIGGAAKTPYQKLSCGFPCLNTCIPRTASDYSYYCQLGCHLKRCIPLTINDDATLEECFGWCTHLCNKI